MLKTKQTRGLVTLLFCAQFFVCQDVYAYLDPGTGSYFLQMFLASILGASFVLKTYFHKIKTLLRAKNPFSKKREK